MYALIALGYSLVYGILKFLNFAHGDVFMVGTFIGIGVLQLSAGRPTPSSRSWLARPHHPRGDGGVRGARRRHRAIRVPPFADAPRIAPLISALGVSFFLTYSMQLMFGAEFRDYDIFDLDQGALRQRS